MKKMRIASCLMAAITALSMSSLVASAADSVQVTVGKDSKAAGENYSVTVDLAGVPSSGLSSIDFAINYDPSVISVKDVTLGSIGNTGAAAQEGELGDTLFSWNDTGKQIIVIWATGLTDSKYFVSKDGTFLTISGTVKSDAKDGAVSKLEVVPVDRAAYPQGGANADVVFSAVGESATTDYTAAITNGSVTVGSVVTPTEGDWGNVDCSEGETPNDRLTVSDAVLLARYVAGDKTVKVSEQGAINAHVNGDDLVNDEDLTLLLQYLAKKVDYAKLGPQ